MRLFLAAFFLVYGAMHVYFFLKAKTALALGGKTALLLGFLLFFMVLSPVSIRLLERVELERAARLFAWVGYVWMGILFLFLSISLMVEVYGLSVRLAARIVGKDLSSGMPSLYLGFHIPFVLALFIAIYGFAEAQNIRTERISIKSPKIPGEAGKIRIVQISDVHIGLIVTQERTKRILDIVKRANPDILVSTGDLVDGQAFEIDGISEFFWSIRPRYGKFAVTGNHEFYVGLDKALDFTRKSGFIVLRGSGATIADILNIAGVDDIQGMAFNQYIGVNEKEMLSGLPSDKFTVLLKHRPEVDAGAQGLFDLQLSGHTHRGQIFPFGLIVHHFYPKLSGFFALFGGSKLYVSRGTGTWGPPIRFLSPPEITVIDIINDKAHTGIP